MIYAHRILREVRARPGHRDGGTGIIRDRRSTATLDVRVVTEKHIKNREIVDTSFSMSSSSK